LRPHRGVFKFVVGFDDLSDHFLVLGVCTICRTIGNLEFPSGFDFKAGDKIMDGKATKAMCLGCGKLTEFLPYHKLEGGGYGGPGWDFLKRSQKIVKEIGGIGE